MLRCGLRDCCRPVCLKGGLRIRPSGSTAVRSLHVQPLPAADLVAKATGAIIQDSATTTEAPPHEASKLTLFASRQLNRPAVKISGEVIPLDINYGIDRDVSDRLATAMGTKDLLKTVGALYELWKAHDLLRLEAGAGIRDGDAVLSDVSITADDFALYRQPQLSLIADTSSEHPLETQAKAGALFYHKNTKRKGNIAAYGYGAGVAMSTMDALAAAGGRVSSCHVLLRVDG